MNMNQGALIELVCEKHGTTLNISHLSVDTDTMDTVIMIAGKLHEKWEVKFILIHGG